MRANRMNTNWTKPRRELVNTGVNLIRRHRSYTPEAVAESLTNWHYIGKCPERAANLLARDIRIADYRTPTPEYLELQQMQQELQAEGWKFLTVQGKAGFWWHTPTGLSVNCNGGGFEIYIEATRRAYNSQVRDWIRRRL